MSRITNKKVTTGYLNGAFPFYTMKLMNRVAKFAGVDAIWFGDHYVNFYPPKLWTPEHTPAAKFLPTPDAIYDHVAMMSATAMQIKNTTIGSAVTEPCRHHPMALAQRFVTLDHMSKGHAVLGIGAGEYENTAPYGIDFSKPVARLEEALQVIQLFWNNPGKPISFDGKYFQLHDAYYDLPFYENTPPPIYIAAHGPRMLRMTGRYGDGWLPSLLPSPGEYRQSLSVIKEAANGAGRSTEHFVPGQLVPFALGKTKDQIMEKVLRSPIAAATCMLMPDAKWKAHGLSHPLGEGHAGFFKIMPHRVTEEEVYAVLENLTPELVESSFWVGTKDDLLEKCANLVDEGARHLAMIDMTPLFDEMSLPGLLRQIQLIRAAGRL